MRVRDLLRMSTGHRTEPPRAENRRAYQLDEDVSRASGPLQTGHDFLYNTSATYMLSAIVQKATGENVLDYLQAATVRAAGH